MVTSSVSVIGLKELMGKVQIHGGEGFSPISTDVSTEVIRYSIIHFCLFSNKELS